MELAPANSALTWGPRRAPAFTANVLPLETANHHLDSFTKSNLILNLLAEVAQLVEHGTENAGVDSSILSLGTTTLKIPLFLTTVASNRPASNQIPLIHPAEAQ